VLSRIILARHGRTAWHAEGRYAGTTDVPLDEVGVQQAERVAERLKDEKIEMVFSSPLSRCLAVAEMVADLHGLEVMVDDRLRELDLGRWDGEMLDEIVKRDGEILKRWTRDPTSVTIPGGESLLDAQRRSMDWLGDASARHADGLLFASSHGGPIRAILAAVIGLPLSNLFRLTVDLASISILNHKGKFSNLETMNERAHLDGLEDKNTL
jgi:broad specificity phosphatase PhoE